MSKTYLWTGSQLKKCHFLKLTFNFIIFFLNDFFFEMNSVKIYKRNMTSHFWQQHFKLSLLFQSPLGKGET